MLGLKRGTVRLEIHREQWHEIAADIIEQIREVLGQTAIDAQHVGSTSICGICAKPIIDIAVAVKELKDMDPYTDLLAQKGIVFRKQDVEGQLLYVMGDFAADTRTHHIHVVVHGSEEWNHYIRFRDYLRAFPEKAKIYEALKRSLSEVFSQDRSSYTGGKQELIRQLLEEADAWYEISGKQ